MNALETDRIELAAKLLAAGVPATTNPAELPPMVLIGPPTMIPTSLGIWALEYVIRVVVPPPGDVTAQEWMTDQVEVIAGTVTIDRASPGTELVGEDRLPAYLIELSRDIPNPYC